MAPNKEQVLAFRKELAEKRERITLLRAPITTTALFVRVVVDYVIYAIKSLLTSVPLWLTVLPLAAGYGFLRATEHHLVADIDEFAQYAMWWVGLGVLSSVGLGSGMHSGILFLFPHIFRVVSASKHCPSMQFDSYCDVWWQNCPMVCTGKDDAAHPDEASFLAVFSRVIVPAFLWGAGTAMGEIPPYAVSRAAALAGKDLEELDEAKGDDVLSRMKAWMIDFVEKYGFWGVLVMSAWPNAAFDLVGICCGQLNVSFWTFFIATLIGKAVIKVSGQAVFFVFWFRNPHMVIQMAVKVVDYLPDFVPITAEQVEGKLNDALDQVSHGKAKEGEEESLLKKGGEILVLSVIGYFVYSCICEFAQQRQKTFDDARIEHFEKTGKKDAPPSKAKTE